jgi:hypothetical protein
VARTRKYTKSAMNEKQVLEALAIELKNLDIQERWRRVRDLPVSTLVQLVGVKWRSVGDYAADALHSHPDRENVRQLIIDTLIRREFRHVDARVRALGLLKAMAAKSEGAKTVYRMYLNDRSSGVVGCAIPGCVWSLDDEAIQPLIDLLNTTEDEYLKQKVPMAIEAIEKRDPRLLQGGSYDPKKWGITFPD